MLIVALTGGIATGKSVVAEILSNHGCFVQSADRLARDLMKPGRPAWRQILVHFGPNILHPDNTINRRRLGKIIFSSRQKRLFLNGLIHPLVMARKKRTIRTLEKRGTYKIFVSEAALTVEAGFALFFDKIIVVHCPERLQVERLMRRDGIGRSEARKRIRCQMPTSEKMKWADYLIDTSGSLEETALQTEEVYRNLLLDFRKKRARDKKSPARTRRRGPRPGGGS
jgi:dephospho-CoA kinase